MSLLAVLLALAALRWGGAWLALPALLACAWAGLTFPDLDQPLPLDHRSALTHAVLPALGLAAKPWAHPAAAGLALGLAFHLAADVFPNAMTGYATVAIPFAGRLGAAGSYAWLLANAAACALLGGRLLHAALPTIGLRLFAALGVATIGLPYLLRVDGGWPVLALLAVALWLLVRGDRLPALIARARR